MRGEGARAWESEWKRKRKTVRCRFELFTILLCGFRPFFLHYYSLIFLFIIFISSFRHAAYNTAKHEIHFDKRRRGVDVVRGDRRPTDTHFVDQRLRSTQLQKHQSQVMDSRTETVAFVPPPRPDWLISKRPRLFSFLPRSHAKVADFR